MIKNKYKYTKYIIIYLMFLILITVIFNKNINQFKDLKFYNIIYISFIFNGVLLYITYVKFNIMVRCLSFIKRINFFYNQIKLNKIKFIKSIIFYYYIFNICIFIFIFLRRVSILFIINFHNNIYNLNLEYYIEFTNLISFLLLLYYSIYIITMKYHIIDSNKNINLLVIVLNILIIFIPVITINYYYDNFNIFDNKFTIHCDSKGNTNFYTKIKENPSIVITNNSNSNSIINNKNLVVYINTTKDISENKTFNVATSSETSQDTLNKLVTEIKKYQGTE